jgi:hypothetical protein
MNNAVNVCNINLEAVYKEKLCLITMVVLYSKMYKGVEIKPYIR